MMEKNYLVSVVVPVYNSQKYLDVCLNSIINQSYKNLEIVLVDDGSDDNSFIIINNYAKSDSRIKVYKQKHMGVFFARKFGIEKSQGSFICSVDSDDFLDLKYIETLLNFSVENDLDVAQCSFKCEDSKNDLFVFDKYAINIKNNYYDVLLKWLHGELFFGSQIFTKLFKAQLIKGIFKKINVSLNEGDDVIYFLYYLKNANRIGSINNVLYHYRYRLDSLSHKISINWLLIELHLIDNLVNIIKKEYPLLNKNEISVWKRKYALNRIRDYLKFRAFL